MNYLKENLDVLSKHFPYIATALAPKIQEHNKPLESAFFAESTRVSVPTYGYKYFDKEPPQVREKKVYFHSRINPIQEAQRIAHQLSGITSLVHIGMGSLAYLTELLSISTLDQCILIEPSMDFMFFALQNDCYHTVITDTRISIITPPIAKKSDSQLFLYSVAEYLEQHLVPLFTPHIAMRTLHNRSVFQSELTERLISLCSNILHQKTSEHSIMQHFGRRWQKNIITNCARSSKSSITKLPYKKNAILLGAGPGVKIFLSLVQQKKLDTQKYSIIATDSVLPTLMKSACPIDFVCANDPQVYSYLHGYAGYPGYPWYFFSLSSYVPPRLQKDHCAMLFVAGPHPLERYICKNNAALLRIPRYGSNVSSFAAIMAKVFGLNITHVFGCDFSYPAGTRYAKETYTQVFDFWQSNRLKFLDTQSVHRLSSEGASISFENSMPRYHTKRLSEYKQEFTTLLSNDSDVLGVEFSEYDFSKYELRELQASQSFRSSLLDLQNIFSDFAASTTINKVEPAVRACIPFATHLLATSRDTTNAENHHHRIELALKSAITLTKDYIAHTLADR